MAKYKWHFAKTGGGAEQGFEDSSMAYFKSDPHHYIARETIQNSLDARDETNKGEPVVVEFRLFRENTSNAIPDIDDFKRILKENIESNKRNPNGASFFKNALKKVQQQNLNILAISDSNTVGVKDINKNQGRWHGLIKMIGKGSQQQRNMGGTFGIGKAAPFVCSELRTVFYNTKNEQDKSAFIWKSIFTTHGSPKKQGYGFYCDYSVDKTDETHANGITSKKLKPNFADRSHNGTDLFILGFKKPSSKQSWHVLFKRVIINNYFAALYDNELRVIMKDDIDGKNYELNSSNILEDMKKDYIFFGKKQSVETNYPFIDAYTDVKNQIVRDLDIKGLGKCKMYLKLFNDYPRRVAFMRLPKMLVYHERNPRLKSGYAALFICENKKGNKFLSQCEGPTHQEWKKGWHKNPDGASKILRRISVEINKVLASLIIETYDEETIISGLEQFTYSDENELPMDGDGNSGENNDEGEDGFTLDEVILETNDLDFKKPNPEKQKKRKRKVKVEDGFDAGDEEGSGSGGREDDSKGKGDLPSEKGFGEMDGKKDGEWKMKKLPKSAYNYKCFQISGSNAYNLVISTKIENKCQIRIYSAGIDPQSKRNEALELEGALDQETGQSLPISSNYINSVETSTNPKTLELELKQNRKFGMEIEVYA